MSYYKVICERKKANCSDRTLEALSDLREKTDQLEFMFGDMLSHISNKYDLMVKKINGCDVILSGAENVIPNIGRRDGIESMIASFSVGINSVETLLKDGAYIQTCAVLRQELEILTQIHHFSNETYQEKQAPNIKVLEEGYRKLYGKLSKVAHLSCKKTIDSFTNKCSGTSQTLLSPLLYSLSPEFNKELCDELMAFHALVFIEVIEETQKYIKEFIPGSEFEYDNKLESIRQSILEDFGKLL